MTQSLKSLQDLVSYMRGNKSLKNSLEGGCPWHKKLSLSIIAGHLKGETQELLEAIERVDNNSNPSEAAIENLKEELGDVFLQVLVTSEIMEEKGLFNFSDVCQRLETKLRFRSPHLFEKAGFSSLKEIEDLWQQRKAMEKKKAH